MNDEEEVINFEVGGLVVSRRDRSAPGHGYPNVHGIIVSHKKHKPTSLAGKYDMGKETILIDWFNGSEPTEYSTYICRRLIQKGDWELY